MALSTYWGVASSGVLLAGVLPAFLAWFYDVRRFASVALPDGAEKNRRELIKDERLDFAPGNTMAALLTIATPALSGPAVGSAQGHSGQVL